MTDKKDAAAPWWKAYPEARAKCPEISADDVMSLFDDMDITSEPKPFLLVDVRRDDWELDMGGICSIDENQLAGSSSGRGPRCAGWMQDYIEDVAKFGKKSKVDVLVLKGGIKGWVKDFEGALMDGFEEKYWEQFK
ncbi:hypothetical protein ACMFMG_000250 [Clarireedia jacksonii]